MELSSERKYFCAMNTADGFCSHFSDIFGDIGNLFIIKGGPGTGKSRLMKDFAAAAKSNGFTVEEFYCSSDVSSLDGVIAKELDCAFIDGTAPHTFDPITPGAKDNIINLGQFWNSSYLAGRRSEIEILNEQKAKLYKSVYLYLGAVKRYDEAIRLAVEGAVFGEKLSAFTDRFLGILGHGSGFKSQTRIKSAVSTSGFVEFDSYSKMAKNRYAIIDFCGTGGLFTMGVLQGAKKQGLSVTVSYNPYDKNVPDAIYFHESDTAVYIGCSDETAEKTINMRRFVDDSKLKLSKSKIRVITKLKQGCLERMYSDFAEIQKIHGKIEEIYCEAMNFSEKESFCNELIESILNSKKA